MKRTILALLLAAATGAFGQEKPRIWVHAPAEDLLALFPGKEEGFLISLQEYERLLAAAKAREAELKEQPPLSARLVKGVATATVKADLLELEGSYVAVVQKDGPAEVAFPLEGIALESISIDGGELAGSSLRFDRRGAYSFTVNLSARLQESGGVSRAQFRLPPAAGQKVTLNLPAGVEGEVGPIVRAFSTGPKGGQVVGYPDETGLFTLWFRPRAPARDLAPLLALAFRVRAQVGEAGTVAYSDLDVSILRAPLDRLEILLPKGGTIRGLSGKRVKSWRLVRGGNDGDRLLVRLTEPVEGTVAIKVESEAMRENADRAPIPIPRLAGAARYSGSVSVQALRPVRITGLDSEGMRRLNSSPKKGVGLFRVWSQKARLIAEVDRLAAKTQATTRALLVFREGGKTLRASVVYTIAGEPLFRLVAGLPAGWTLRSLKLDGRDTPHRFEEQTGHLVIDFPNGLKPGRHLLDATLDTDEVDWVPEKGRTTFALQGLRAGLEDESGLLVVAADPAFRVSAKQTAGLLPVGMPVIARAGFRLSDRILYAWRFERPGYAASFALERHEPQITAAVVTSLLPSERLLKVHSSIRLDIQRTGVRELKVALPKGTGKLVDFKGPMIKEKRAPAAGADPETWTLVFQKRMRGAFRIEVAFDRKFKSDDWSASAPEIALPGVNDRGFIVVYSSGSTAITIERKGLRTADIGELPEATPRPPLEVLAYAGHPYEARIASKRHEPEAVIQAIALSAHIQGVLTQEGRLRCRAEYRIRNNDQPFLDFALPPESLLLGALVDGKPAKPLVEKGLLKLALPRSKNRTAPFSIALIYESRVDPLQDAGQVTIARPVLDIDVLKTVYTLGLPGDYELTGHDGDLVPIESATRPSLLRELAGLVQWRAPAGTAHVVEQLDDKQLDDKNEAESDAEFAKTPAEREFRKKSRKEGKFRGPNSGAPPGLRGAAEEPAPAAPPAPEKRLEAGILVAGRGGGGRAAGAHGGVAQPPARRRRPERALLSLDIKLLSPDNIVRLQSLAPTGEVTLSYAHTADHARYYFLGIVLGAALGIILLIRRRLAFLRILAGAGLGILALHFAGLSFLQADLAIGAGETLLAVLALALLIAILRAWKKAGRWYRRGAATAAILLLATQVRAQEQEVLVPYRNHPDRIDRVLLPAQEYHRLRKLADPETAGRATVLTQARYAAHLEAKRLTVKADYEILKETAGAERVPLGLQHVAITRALLDGKPATLLLGEHGYLLVLSNKGRYHLSLELRPRLLLEGDRARFAVPVRPAAGARLTIEDDRKGYEQEVTSLGGKRNGEWELGPVGLLAVTWNPKTEGFKAEAAELRARTKTVVAVRDGYTGLAARIGYTISGGTVRRLRIRIDKALALTSVTCPDLAGWRIDDQGDLIVALSKPAEKSLEIEIHGERPAPRERTETLPVIQPLDVLRDAGVIVIDTLPDLKIEVLATSGLMRGSARMAPAKLAAAPDTGVVQSLYRFATRPFRLEWKVFLEPTRMRATNLMDLRVDREMVVAEARIEIDVERGPGPYTLSIGLPDKYEVVSVGGKGVREWWTEKGLLRIDRSARQKGAVTYRVLLRRRVATKGSFDAPSLAVRDVARESGRVRIAVADGLALEAGKSAGLLPEDISRAGRVRWGRLVRAYRFVTVPWSLVLHTREEPREMEALVVSRILPLADRIRVETLVNYHVRRGLVDRLSFVVPVQNEGDALIDVADLREERSEAVQGGRRYILLLRTPTRGSASATVSYDLPLGSTVRGVEPEDAIRVRRYVAVEKIPDGEVRAGKTTNLEPGEYEDLPLQPPGTTARTVARVFVGSGGPFRLELAIKRHTFEEMAQAVIYRAAARAVVDRSGWARVDVAYRVYNRSRQFLRLRLPAGARLYSVLVAGQGVRPLGEKKDLLVPLRKLSLGAPTFDVDVVYAYRGPALGEEDFDVRLPEVKGLDVLRTTLSVYLPRGFSYDFDTAMEKVDASDIAAGEVTDIYQESKELASVVERGSALQKQRAAANFQRLAQQAKRATEDLRVRTRDQLKLQQLESQQRALDTLSREIRDAAKAQTAGTDRTRANKKLKSRDWSVNRVYLAERSKDEEAKQILEFAAVQKEALLKDKEAASKRPAARKRSGGKAFGDIPAPSTNAAIGIGGGGGAGGSLGRISNLADRPLDFEDDEIADAKTDQGIGGLAAPPKKGFFFLGAVDNYAGRPEQTYKSWSYWVGERNRMENLKPDILRAAKGRISLRIDLPKQPVVYYFARLGANGGVRIDASSRSGHWLQGLLALVCAAGALFVIRIRAAGAKR